MYIIIIIIIIINAYIYIYIFSLGLCAWVINIVNFYEVFCDVEPKRKALATANADLAAAQEKLSKIKAKIKVPTFIKL